MAMKRYPVRQHRTKQNPGATLDAPYYLEDAKGSGSVTGKPASTNPGSPTQRVRSSRRQKKG